MDLLPLLVCMGAFLAVGIAMVFERPRRMFGRAFGWMLRPFLRLTVIEHLLILVVIGVFAMTAWKGPNRKPQALPSATAIKSAM